jgi:hypothetical protein
VRSNHMQQPTINAWPVASGTARFAFPILSRKLAG